MWRKGRRAARVDAGIAAISINDNAAGRCARVRVRAASPTARCSPGPLLHTALNTCFPVSVVTTGTSGKT